jgi:hypothetical protein
MTQISLPRLYALRLAYLILAVGLGLTVWPGIVHHAKPWGLSQGVVRCMLGAISALAFLGLRYPLRMLPLLFFEVAWKAIWLLVVAAPLWSAGRMDPDTLETANECLVVLVIAALIPWPYVAKTYLSSPGDRWLGGGGGRMSAPEGPTGRLG